MNEQKYPQFERLHILRTEALCTIRDRAFELLPMYLCDHSDGIVSGCKLSTTSEKITLNPGLILHKKFLYFIREPMSVDYAPTDEYIVLKLIFEPSVVKENFVHLNLELSTSSDLILAENEMELCRFKLKRGAILRTNHTDFFDLATEFDTVNPINAPFSAIGGATLSPEILQFFAREAKDFSLSELDLSFCMTALSGKVLNPDQIIFYIEHRLKIELTSPDNQLLYEKLCQILSEIKNNGRREILTSSRRRREIMID